MQKTQGLLHSQPGQFMPVWIYFIYLIKKKLCSEMGENWKWWKSTAFDQLCLNFTREMCFATTS